MAVWKRVPRRVTSVLSHCPPLSLFFAPPSLFSPTLVSADGRRVGGRVSASTSFVIHFYFLRAKLSFLLCIVFTAIWRHLARFVDWNFEISHSRGYALTNVFTARFRLIVFQRLSSRLMSFSSLTLIRRYRGIKRTLVTNALIRESPVILTLFPYGGIYIYIYIYERCEVGLRLCR